MKKALAPIRNLWLDLITLFIYYGFVGWLLSGCQASATVWLITEIIVVYLAWIGTGAIALSIISSTGIIGIGVMTSDVPDFLLWLPLSLNPAQAWASTFGLSWLWATFVIFKLAFVTQRMQLNGWKHLQAFWVMVLITNLGLRVGQLLEIKLL